MRVVLTALLLALPAPVFLVYLGLIGRMTLDWSYFWPNYAWCSAILFGAAVVLAGVRARFRTWLTALCAGNAALIGFCLWMASLISRGYSDTEIGWVFLFPIQVTAIAVSCWIDARPGRMSRGKGGDSAA